MNPLEAFEEFLKDEPFWAEHEKAVRKIDEADRLGKHRPVICIEITDNVPDFCER